MSKRYIVAEGQEFSYPADLISQQVIKSAGGRSKLTEEDKKKIKIKTVTAGEDCSDMPAAALALYISRGLIYDSKVIAEEDAGITLVEAEEIKAEKKESFQDQINPVPVFEEPAPPAEEEGE